MNPKDAAEHWLALAVQGDRLAVQKLIMLYHGRLEAMASRKIPSQLRAKVDPDDLLQQVYADALRKMGDFKDRGNEAFFAWLVKILESKLIDAERYYHAQVRDVARETPPRERSSFFVALAEHAALDSLTPSRVVARQETEGLLHAALAGLSEDHRRVLELRFIQGLPLADVSAAMGRSAPAAQMLCARALERLRHELRNLSMGNL